MQQKALGFFVLAAVIAGSLGACATGVPGIESHPQRDSGPAPVSNDGSTKLPDSGQPPPPPQNDASTPIQDGSTCNLTVCGSFCVDTTSDNNNCGGCNKVCPSGSSCTNGQCVCSGGLSLCSGTCVDTMSDNSNCGSCNHVCASNTTCTSGTCQTQASGAPPQGSCSHSLCDLNDDTALVPGCDPAGCVNNVCNADSYCCTDFWDSFCVGEVATYCSPYTC